MEISVELPESFLEEETSCGFVVTEQRKKLWAVELDLFEKFDRICREHGLKYCGGAGTMLGAVRHKGFIPWDDDMDLFMIREDYDRFISLASEFQYPYFLQCAYTEEHYLRPYARLRNVSTTGASKTDLKQSVNTGVFIDIFPVDGVPTGRIKDNIQNRKDALFKKLFLVYYHTMPSYPVPKTKFRKVVHILCKPIWKLLIRDKIKLFRAFEKNLKRYSAKGTEIWGNRTLNFKCPRSRRPYSDWTDLISVPFEFMEIPIPRNYDSMLRQQYGDYMKIPKNKGGSMHGELLVSIEYAHDEPRRLQ